MMRLMLRRKVVLPQPDGSYVQRTPPDAAKSKSSQQQLIEWTERRVKEATRLRRRKPRALQRRSGR